MSFFRSLHTATLNTYRYFEKCLESTSRIKAQKSFLQQCAREQVIPRTFDPCIMNDSAPFHKIRRLLLKDRIENANQQLDDAHHTLRGVSRELQGLVDPERLQQLKDTAQRRVAGRTARHTQSLSQKLHRLCRNTPWERFSLKENVHNRSSRSLTDNEYVLLGLGSGFNSESNKGDIIGSVDSFQYFMSRNGGSIKDMNVVRGIIPFMLESLIDTECVLPERFEKAKSSLLADSSITILLADKGGQVVVLNRNDYNIAMLRLLSGPNYEKTSLTAMKRAHTTIRSEVRGIYTVLTSPGSNFEEIGELMRNILPENPSAAKFYGIPKLHKATDTNLPFRPIVSSIGTLTRNLAAWLAKQLQPLVGEFSGAHIENNLDFKNKLQQFASGNTCSDFKMLSLDVKSLFTQVPLDDVLNFLERVVARGTWVPPIPFNHLRKLIEICANNCFLEWDGDIYRQTFGVAMGSPLSPVLANLYMEYFEREILPSLQQQPLLWLRYVDDCFVIWPNNQDFDQFLHQLNDAVPSIEFSVEFEQNGFIPFLDTKVIRNDLRFLFDVYRKDGHSNSYIHWFSNHSRNTKRGSLFGLFLRAYRICDEAFIENEIKIIKTSFSKLGYPWRFIMEVLRDVKRRHFSPNQPSNDNQQPPTISLPRNDFTEKYINPVFKAQGIRVVNKATNTIGAALLGNKRGTGSAPDAGVYVVPCHDCTSPYVGQTGQFRVRCNAHTRDVHRGSGTGALVSHERETGHTMNVEGAKIVYPSKRPYRRKLVESALMQFIPNINIAEGEVKDINSHTCHLMFATNKRIMRILSDNPG